MVHPINTFKKKQKKVNNLNDQCLRHIFSFLPILERLRIEKVCPRWRKIGRDGWNDIEELTIHGDYSDEIIHSILQRCGRYLKKLKVFDATQQSNWVPMAIKFCQLDQLEEIELIDLRFRNNIHNLKGIFEEFKNLVAVSLQLNFRPEIFAYLNLLNPKTLQKLDLRNINPFKSALQLLSRSSSSIDLDRFPNLKELNLERIDVMESGMIREKKSLKGLEIMDLNRCYVSRNIIQRICTFPNLQKLSLGYDIAIEDEDIRHVARHCDKIKEMSLKNPINLTSACFQYLGGMQSLETLNLEKFSMKSRDLAYLTNVKKLRFHHCSDIAKGDGLIKLIKISSNLEKLEIIKIPALARLYLGKIELIFQSGQRNKPLTIIMRGRTYECLNSLEGVTYHPLLNLKVDNDFDENDNK